MWTMKMNFLLIASTAILISAANSEPLAGKNGTPQISPELLQNNNLEPDSTTEYKQGCISTDKSNCSPEETATYPEDNSDVFLEEKMEEKNLLRSLMMKISSLSLQTQNEMADRIVITANRGLELIDSFKDGFVNEILGSDWQRADQKYSPGYITDAPYLPKPPQELCNTCLLDVELTRSYALMQRCAVSLEVLNLDQVLKNRAYFYFGNVSEVAGHVVESLNYLKSYMAEENCSPNLQETDAMTAQIYEDVNKRNRDIRDFVILRDVRSSFENMRDTFRRIRGM